MSDNTHAVALRLEANYHDGGILAAVLRDAANHIERLEAELAEARTALPDPAKLRTLADWFDREQDRDSARWASASREVQCDLRKWAEAAEAAKGSEGGPAAS